MKFGMAIQHKIMIEPTANQGFVVKVGCCRRSYESSQSMIEDLMEYLSDPQGAERLYNESNGGSCDPEWADPQPDEQVPLNRSVVERDS